MDGPRAVPGLYTVRLTVDGVTRTSPLRIVGDPRGEAPAAELDAQLAYALRLRDDVSKVTSLVNQVRSVREQLQARAKALDSRKSEPPVAELLNAANAAIARADAIEDTLHNRSAEVVYDILAMRGGTRLYSRLAPLQMWASEAEGAPTAGMMQVAEQQETELAQLSKQTEDYLAEDVASLNATASRLGLSFVIVR
jgi:cell division septum initiation protein DivIVA